MKKILIAIIGVLMAVPLWARDFTYTHEGQTLTYTVIDETAKTCKTTGSKVAVGEVMIPSVASDGINEYIVTEINHDAFKQNRNITSISIPGTVTKIGENAFGHCFGLTSVEIPNSVKTIDQHAFWNCKGLTSIEIPNSVTSIGQSAFESCTGLTSIEIPNSVTSIGNAAFSGCN